MNNEPTNTPSKKPFIHDLANRNLLHPTGKGTNILLNIGASYTLQVPTNKNNLSY